MHKIFSFKGMNRNCDSLLAGEGETLELVNLRFVDGSLRPVPELESETTLPRGYSRVFWHEMAECYLCITDDSNSRVCFYDSGWNPLSDAGGNELAFDALQGVRSVEFVGYLAACIAATGIYFILYDNGCYRFLGERPPVPQLNITLSSKLHEVTTSASFSPDTLAANLESSWRFNEKGYFDECISYLNKKGYFIDRTLLRFALRLFDGSYIYCSHVIYVSDSNVIDYVGRDADNLVSQPIDGSADMSHYKVKVLGFKPSYSFTNLDLGAWDGVVVGIDLFASGSVMGKKPDAFMITLHCEDASVRSREMIEAYVEKELDELWNDISGVSQFYKVAEFDVNGNCLNSVDDVSLENLVLQPGINSSEKPFSFNSVAAGCSYMFNNRLHIGNLREWFCKGYDAPALMPSSGEYKTAPSVVVQTKIKTKNSTATVVKDYGSITLGYKNGCYELSPLLTYPDSRAYEMTLLVNTGREWLTKTFGLCAHSVLNCAQYLHKWYLGHIVTVESQFSNGASAAEVLPEDVLEIFSQTVGVHEVIYSSSLGGWTYEGRLFPPDKYSSLRVFAIPRGVADGDKIIFTIVSGVSDTTFKDIDNIPVDSTWSVVPDGFSLKEETPFEDRPNVVKVSMVDNPFLFPAKSVYSPSQGTVVGLASNSVALSQGQFGEHPLYIFCDNGIWAMAVDSSGALAYSNSFPISREVYNGNGLLLGIDNGVVFLSDKGVMLLSGSRISSLSASMDKEDALNNSYTGSAFLARMSSAFFPSGVVSIAGFMMYMKQARAAYMPRTGELLFVNPGHSFCYIYTIANGAWSKMACKISGVINTYPSPKLFVCDSSVTNVLSLPNAIAGDNRILLYTRPLLWGSKLPKRVMQLMLHAFVDSLDSSSASPFLGCYLLCSNDGVNFKIVSGVEIKRKNADMVFPYFPTQSYKYFALAIMGRVGKGSYITGAELEIAFAWNNRLK